jgi:hypothetical protein
MFASISPSIINTTDANQFNAMTINSTSIGIIGAAIGVLIIIVTGSTLIVMRRKRRLLKKAIELPASNNIPSRRSRVINLFKDYDVVESNIQENPISLNALGLSKSSRSFASVRAIQPKGSRLL